MENDLISRKKLLEALGDEPMDFTGDPYSMGCKNQWEWDTDIIKMLPAEEPEKQNWIPCSVRMPNEQEYGQVLITIFGTVEEATYDDISGTGKPCFHIGDFTRSSYTDVTKCVTAWMPKPKPYEGGNDEICRSK